MKSIAQSYSSAICARVDEALASDDPQLQEQRLLLPSLPAAVVRRVGEDVSNYVAAQDQDCRLLYRVAHALGQEWSRGTPADIAEFGAIENAGWYDAEDHLTAYRNATRVQSDAVLVVVLVGTDRVLDKASLGDFFQLNLHVLWRDVMEGGFSGWLRQFCDQHHIACEPEEESDIDSTFRYLVSHSLADLPRISSYLDDLDITGVQDGADLRDRILGNLRVFGMPAIRGLTPFNEKRLNTLLQRALGFFSYADLLEPRSRRTAKEQIEAFRDDLQNGSEELSKSDYAAFDSPDAFLSGLSEYVDNGNREARESLFACNFLTVAEKILRKRKGSGQKSTPRTPRLAGQPLEVFLRAAWMTLEAFRDESQSRGEVPHECFSTIAFESMVFWHDVAEEDGDSSSAADINEQACEYLSRLVGGIDLYLENHLLFHGLRTEGGPTVQSRLAPQGDADHCGLAFKSARTGEPRLRFKIAVVAASELKTERMFEWRLPRTHPFRAAAKLFDWAHEEFQGGKVLPVYRIPHYVEIMHSADPDDLHRILLQAVTAPAASATNLLACGDVDSHDPLYVPLSKLASAYADFVADVHKHGLYHGLDGDRWSKLQSAYEAAFQTVLNAHPSRPTEMSPLLFRAFFMLPEIHTHDEAANWRSYEPNALVSALHPALLEIVRHQAAYLLRCFDRAAVEGLRSSSPRALRRANWDALADLAQIECPLPGLLTDGNGRLSTNVVGDSLLHKLGDAPTENATLTTRLLMRYESTDDEGVPDSQLFATSRESNLIWRTIRDYAELHPFANDAMSVAFFVNDSIQPAIAGLDAFLQDVADDATRSRSFHLDISFFSEIADDSTVARYVREWQERWTAERGASAKTRYSDCQISVSHRLVAPENAYQQFADILREGFDCDLFFLIDFIKAGADVNQLLSVPRSGVRDRMLFFPILQRTGVARQGGGKHHQRLRILSNRQFPLSACYTDLLACMRNDNTPLPPDTEALMIGIGDFAPWGALLDQVHRVATWVVCLDPCIDEPLISKQSLPGSPLREIIGFGSGVGAHGEQNYTVSTEHTRPAHLRERLASRIQSLLGPWDNAISEAIASSVWNQSKRLSGLSLIRATGLSDYVRDYAAYGLVRQLMGDAGDDLCRILVSLDAFRHWFDGDAHRPDLLWLTVRVSEGVCRLDAHLIECKLANKNDRYLETAWMQLKCGLDRLVPSFMPRRKGKEGSDDERPDQRFWWLQLHRVIASHTLVSPSEERSVTSALENLAEGCFEIRWRASAITFWTDSDSDALTESQGWDYCYGSQTMPIRLFETGRHFIRLLCTEDDETRCLPASTAGLSFACSADIPPADNRDKGGRSAEGLGPDDGEEGDRPQSTDSPPSPPLPPSHNATVSPRQAEGMASSPSAGASDQNGADDNQGQDDKSVATRSASRPVNTDGQSPRPETEGEYKTAETAPAKAPVSPKVPERVLLGHTVAAHREVFWEFGHHDLGNRHLLIFGTSGMGKTYSVQALLLEMGMRAVNSLIVDYTNGFLNSQIEEEVQDVLCPLQHYVQQEPLPINPFRQQLQDIGDKTHMESASTTAQRVAGVFSEVYNLGDQQYSALYQTVKLKLESGGDCGMTLRDLIPALEEFAEQGGAAGSSASSLISKIRPFVDQNPFDVENIDSWERLFTDCKSRCHVLQLAGFSRDVARLITEFSLIDLYRYYRGRGTPSRPQVVVLDEIQNLDHREEGALAQLLTEGRKFGFSLILATQIMSNLARDERDRLFNAAHKLFFRPAETEVKSYATILAASSEHKVDVWVKRLSELKKGECWSLGPSLNSATGRLEKKPFKIRIAALGTRKPVQNRPSTHE